MITIHERTLAKVRVRGRGSGHLEVEGQSEAPVPLMVAITADEWDPTNFTKAVKMVIDLLSEVDGSFVTYVAKNNLDPLLTQTELWHFGDMSKSAEQVLCKAELLILAKPDKPIQAKPRSWNPKQASAPGPVHTLQMDPAIWNQGLQTKLRHLKCSKYSKGAACFATSQSCQSRASSSTDAMPLSPGVYTQRTITDAWQAGTWHTTDALYSSIPEEWWWEDYETIEPLTTGQQIYEGNGGTAEPEVEEDDLAMHMEKAVQALLYDDSSSEFGM